MQNSSKDFFISYNKADRAWAEWIAWQLEAEGYTAVLQAWDFQVGTNFVLAMQQAAASSRRTIAVLSPDYLTALYTQAEWAAAFAQDPTGRQRKLLPVRVRPCELSGILATLAYIDLVEHEESAARSALLAGINLERAKPITPPTFPGAVSLPSASGPAFPGNAPLIWHVPYGRNLLFTGREELLEYLHTTFTSNQATALPRALALSGLGGIGKTQIALEYAYRYAHEYRYVLWATAANTESLLSDITELARLLGLARDNAEQDSAQLVAAFQQWLTQHQDWLLLLDNADDLAPLRALLPRGLGGHVLLTTRAQATGTLAQAIPVEKMSRDESTLLLLRRAKALALEEPLAQASQEQRQEATALAEALDGLPLALDQAGGYIEEYGCSITDYMQFYQQHSKDLLAWRSTLSSEYPATVTTTWALSFEQVAQKNVAAAELLQCCAFLAPDAIPEEIFTECADILGNILEPVAASTFELNQALEVLRRYSLLRRNSASKTLSIHRLVQKILQESLPAEQQRLWAERVVEAINRMLSLKTHTTKSQSERYMPHAYAGTALIEQYMLRSPEAVQLLQNTGHHLYEVARYSEATTFYRQALPIAKSVLGAEHVTVAKILHRLAKLSQKQEQYSEAESLFHQALPLLEQAGESEQLSIATMLYDLGQLYHQRGHYQRAEALYVQAVQLSENQPPILMDTMPFCV